MNEAVAPSEYWVIRAVIAEHRAVGGMEHDPEHSLLHGACRVCVQPWPCEIVMKYLPNTEQPR